MRIEHVALYVPHPLEMARWYVEHLGFEVKRRAMAPPWGHFLADGSGQVMIELYSRADAPIPDYASQHPATLHLALVSRDVAADVERLTRGGATLEGPIDRQPGGDVLAFVRDPWGVCLQLAQRGEPMV
jgi:catechol 2,3-dioxygenase-like lactoylglutathione lyase family enzyme